MTADWVKRRVRRELRQRRGSLAALALSMALVAIIGSAGILGLRAARALVPLAQRNVHVIAYLGDELDTPARARLVDVLKQIPGVANAHLVDTEEAMAHLKAAASSLGAQAATVGVEPGFLPTSVEISVTPGLEMPARAAALAARLRTVPGVVEVDGMSEGMTRLLSWTALARQLCLAVLGAAALAGALTFAWAVLGARPGRRREAEILALFGESPAEIRRASCLAGALVALIGAGVGLTVGLTVVPHALDALEASIGLGSLQLSTALGLREVAAALIAAAGLGWLGGRVGMPLPKGPDA